MTNRLALLCLLLASPRYFVGLGWPLFWADEATTAILSRHVLDRGVPYVGHGTPRSWLAALDTIAAWPVKTFVPGHGEVLDAGRLDLVRGYLRDLVRQVDEARAAGRTLEQARETIVR